MIPPYSSLPPLLSAPHSPAFYSRFLPLLPPFTSPPHSFPPPICPPLTQTHFPSPILRIPLHPHSLSPLLFRPATLICFPPSPSPFLPLVTSSPLPSSPPSISLSPPLLTPRHPSPLFLVLHSPSCCSIVVVISFKYPPHLLSLFSFLPIASFLSCSSSFLSNIF